MNRWLRRFLEIIVILILWPTWPSSIPQDVERREASNHRAKARLFGRAKWEAQSADCEWGAQERRRRVTL
jgi:hypothetical protein